MARAVSSGAAAGLAEATPGAAAELLGRIGHLARLHELIGPRTQQP